MKSIIEILFFLAAIFYFLTFGIEKIVFLMEKKKSSPSLSFGIEKKKRFFFF